MPKIAPKAEGIGLRAMPEGLRGEVGCYGGPAGSKNLCELGVVELRIRAAGGEQLFVRALLDDGSVIHHQDEVRVHDGGKPMRDHEARAPPA